jgi:hypothetical protein
MKESTRSILHLVLLSSLVTGAPLFAAGAVSAAGSDDNAPSQSTLIRIVQENTRQYGNVNVATAEGYAPFLGCVTGPDMGAMGVHYVNGALLNGTLDPRHPQALIYEPSGGKMRLVGVEFIVDQATWDSTHAGVPPVLEKQTFQFVPSPNRFGIPAFYELHVWAWRDNPLGAYVDWNTRVTCTGE